MSYMVPSAGMIEWTFDLSNIRQLSWAAVTRVFEAGGAMTLDMII